MKLTVDIMDDFISSLDLSGEVSSSSDDGTNTTIQVDKTFHLRKGMYVSVDGNSYKVGSVVFNVSITFVGVI